MNENLRRVRQSMPEGSPGEQVVGGLLDVPREEWQRVIAQRLAAWSEPRQLSDGGTPRVD